MWKSKLSEYFGSDFLADGIAYSCAEDTVGGDDHYTWEDFYTEYGDLCVMVSVRALQNVGFAMKHGDKIDGLLQHPQAYMDTDVNTPWNWQPDWIVTKWIQHLEKGAALRPGEQTWKQPNEREKGLLAKFRASVWPITSAKPFTVIDDDMPDEQAEKARLEAQWNEVTPASREEFINLLLAAYQAAPWWVYKDVDASVSIQAHGLINEFSATYNQKGVVRASDYENVLGSCILALSVEGEIVYALDGDIEPGTPEAAASYDRYLEECSNSD